MKQTLEQYLQQVATKLGPISHEERQDELEELRQHLEASVAASVAKGHSPAMAAEEATRQFGTASSLGRQLFFARWRRLLRRTDSVWTATVYASALIVCHISGMPPVFQWIAHLFDSGTTHHTNSTDWGLFWMLLGNPYQLLLSVLYGTILALAAPRNASRGLMV
ncbi:MAG: hypothetical protein H7Z41_05925, partial [Cytophagales bacterium]|nr:hypothetical protein [Armatimonadota bacterium]